MVRLALALFEPGVDFARTSTAAITFGIASLSVGEMRHHAELSLRTSCHTWTPNAQEPPGIGIERCGQARIAK